MAADYGVSRSEAVRAMIAAHEAWQLLIEFLHQKQGEPKMPEERQRRMIAPPNFSETPEQRPTKYSAVLDKA